MLGISWEITWTLTNKMWKTKTQLTQIFQVLKEIESWTENTTVKPLEHHFKKPTLLWIGFRLLLKFYFQKETLSSGA